MKIQNAQSIQDTVELTSGAYMPVLGLGVWEIPDGPVCVAAVRAALDVGYRLIDTAKFYGNEHSVGEAIRASGIPREEIFVTTKLWPTDFGNAKTVFEKSFERLSLEYIDLYLIHWPVPFMGKHIWQGLEKLVMGKRVRSIGVSNYSVQQLENLAEYAVIAPAVNQVQFNPAEFKKDVRDYCADHGIVLEAYSPLGRGRLLSDPRIMEIAAKHVKSPAQILIRFALEEGTVPIPKSATPERIKENGNVFDFVLDTSDMKILESLG